MKKLPARTRFSWNEAWIFASVGGATKEEGGKRLEDIICAADILNHAILSVDEVRDGLRSLSKSGLVDAFDESIHATNHGKTVFENGEKRRGGLFAVVDNMQKALNTPRIKHPEIDKEIDLDFITNNFFSAACRAYCQKANEALNPSGNGTPATS